MKKIVMVCMIIFATGCTAAQVEEFEENYKHTLEEQNHKKSNQSYEVEAPKLSDEDTKLINDNLK